MGIIDCRNMACPTPVVATKRALEEAAGKAVQIIVDAGAPRENVARFAESRGFVVTEAEVAGGFALTIAPPKEKSPKSSRTENRKNGETVMLIASDRLGDGPEELGRLLLKNFMITLIDLDAVPDRMLFLNSGVMLTTEGSEVLEALDRLGNRGVEVLSCGACLDFFHRKDKLRAGMVTNMFTIAESLMKAVSVIKV